MTIAGCLVTLTAITVLVAQYDLGSLNLLVAMLIAATKGTLVALFFMHLKYTNKLYAITLIGSITMVAVFITFIMFDTMARDQVDQIRSGTISDKAEIYQNSTVLDTDQSLLQDIILTHDSNTSKVDNDSK